MGGKEIKNLIQHIEQNSKDYISLLNPIKSAEKDRSDTTEFYEIKSFFQTLTAIEEDVIELRLKKILEEENPYIPAINSQQVKNIYFSSDTSLEDIIERFLDQRQDLVQLLYKTPSNFWDRTGVHETEGHISFEEIVRRMIEKDQANISIIRKNFFHKF